MCAPNTLSDARRDQRIHRHYHDYYYNTITTRTRTAHNCAIDSLADTRAGVCTEIDYHNNTTYITPRCSRACSRGPSSLAWTRKWRTRCGSARFECIGSDGVSGGYRVRVIRNPTNLYRRAAAEICTCDVCTHVRKYIQFMFVPVHNNRNDPYRRVFTGALACAHCFELG